MTVTREQIQDALDASGEMKKYAKSNDDNKFHHYDKINELEQTIRTVLQSALDGMDAPDTAALDAFEDLFYMDEQETYKISMPLDSSVDRQARAIRAALTRPSVGWNFNMDEAPKDEEILVAGQLIKNENQMFVTSAKKYLQGFYSHEGKGFITSPVFAWMPLPAAPKGGDA